MASSCRRAFASFPLSRPPHALRPAAAALLLLCAAPASVLAQPTPPAAGSALLVWNIPAGDLSDTLARIADQGQRSVVASASLLQGRRAPEVRGSFSVEQAAQRALAGSGLVLARTGSNSMTVVAGAVPHSSADDAPGAALATVTVQALAERSGATEGTGAYIARTSTVGAKTALTQREVAQSVSVVTRQQMDDMGMTTLPDALKAMPGVTAFQGSMLADRFLARGFEVGNENLRVDGASPMFRGFSVDHDLAFYDHVEVLRGADGLFGGNGDPGGVINLVRKKPTREKQVQVQAQLGSWNFRRADLDVSGPLSEDGRIRGRGVLAHEDKDFFFDVAHSKRSMAYGVLEADLTPDTTALLGASYVKRDSSYQGYGLPRARTGEDLGLPRTLYLSGADDRADKNITGLFGHLTHRFSPDWTLDVDANHERADQDRFDHYFNGAADALTGVGTTGGANFQKEHWSNASVDAALKGRFSAWGRQHDVLVGGSWSRFSVNALLQRPVPYVPTTVPDIYRFDPAAYLRPSALTAWSRQPSRTENTGIYGSLRLHLSEPLRVIAGGRVGQYKYSFENTLLNASGAVTSTSITRYEDSSVFTPYLAATYDLDRAWTAYASIAETFKSQANNRSGPAPGAPLDPVTGRNYELGLKGAHFDGRLHSALAVYRIERDGAAVRDRRFPASSADLGSSCCFLPTGRIVSKGLDAELTGEPVRGLQLSLSYNYNDNRDKNSTLGGRFNGTSPAHLAKIFAAYQLPGQFGKWKLGGGATVQSKTFINDYAYLRNADGTVGTGTGDFRITQAGYTVYSAFAEYRIDNQWTASLNINNLFDKTYYSSIGYLDYGSFYGSPRSVVLALRGRF